MKVKIDLEMTPEEARRLMGLPDLEPMQQRLLEQVEKQISGNLSYMDPEAIVRAVLPGSQGMEKFQDLLWGVARTAMGGGNAGTKPAGKTSSRKKD